MRVKTWPIALACFLVPVLCAGVFAGTASLSWDPVSDPDLAGYRLYSGPGPGLYNQVKDVGPSITTATAQVPDCQDAYLAVKAIDTAGQESLEFSNEVFGMPAPLVLVAEDSNTGGNRFKTPRGNQPWDYTLTVKGLNFAAGSSVLFSAFLENDTSQGEVLSATVIDCGEMLVTIRTTNATPSGLSDVEVVHPDDVFGVGVGLVEFYHGPSDVGGARRTP